MDLSSLHNCAAQPAPMARPAHRKLGAGPLRAHNKPQKKAVTETIAKFAALDRKCLAVMAWPLPARALKGAVQACTGMQTAGGRVVVSRRLRLAAGTCAGASWHAAMPDRKCRPCHNGHARSCCHLQSTRGSLSGLSTVRMKCGSTVPPCIHAAAPGTGGTAGGTWYRTARQRRAILPCPHSIGERVSRTAVHTHLC